MEIVKVKPINEKLVHSYGSLGKPLHKLMELKLTTSLPSNISFTLPFKFRT